MCGAGGACGPTTLGCCGAPGGTVVPRTEEYMEGCEWVMGREAAGWGAKGC